MEEKHKMEIKNLKIGGFVLIDDVPLRVTSLQTSKPGKHGGAKARIVAVGIFGEDKKTIVKPADTKLDVPIIEKRKFQVIALIGGNAQLMDMEDYSTVELPIPPEIHVKEGDEVLVWKYGKYMMIKNMA